MKLALIKKYIHNNRFIFLLSNFVLFLLWLDFAARHLAAYAANPQFYIIIFILSEVLVAFLFLCRRQEKNISDKPFDYLIAVSSTFLPLFLQPGGIMFTYDLSIFLMSAGVIIQILSVLSLGRSLGIVPANRGIKTKGLYQIVRHPMYFSYFLSYTGYILVSFSAINFTIFVFTLCSVIFRITIEEDFFKKNENYKEYAKKVKWRLVPFIY